MLPDLALVKERIAPYIDQRGPGECWPWTGGRVPAGYGKIKINQKTHSAHRLAYYAEHGSIDPDLNVNHTCIGNRLCCNHAHLYLGTQLQNVHDMHAQRRWVYGQNHHTGKRHLDTEVNAVRTRAAAGESGAAISRDLGIPARTAYDYINKTTRNYGA
jgi:hypothetical protein